MYVCMYIRTFREERGMKKKKVIRCSLCDPCLYEWVRVGAPAGTPSVHHPAASHPHWRNDGRRNEKKRRKHRRAKKGGKGERAHHHHQHAHTHAHTRQELCELLSRTRCCLAPAYKNTCIIVPPPKPLKELWGCESNEGAGMGSGGEETKRAHMMRE